MTKSTESYPSNKSDQLNQNRPKSAGALTTSLVKPLFANQSPKKVSENKPPSHLAAKSSIKPLLYTAMPRSYSYISHPPVFGDYNYYYTPMNNEQFNMPYMPCISFCPYQYPSMPINTNPFINYQYIPFQNYQTLSTSENIYSDIVGQKQEKRSQRRITYYPYKRPYIDYEQHVIMLPIEKTRTKYIQKVYQTEYIKQIYKQAVIESMPIQKNIKKIQYIPVLRKIIHFPKDQTLYTIHQYNSTDSKQKTGLLTPQNTAHTLSVKKKQQTEPENQLGVAEFDILRQSPIKSIIYWANQVQRYD